MAALPNKDDATASSSRVYRSQNTNHHCSSRTRRHIYSRASPQHIFSLTVGAFLCLFFLSMPCVGGIVAVRAAATATNHIQHGNKRPNHYHDNPEYVFHSLEELNRQVLGAPYSFHPVEAPKQAAARESIGRKDGVEQYGFPIAATTTTVEESEAAEALELYTALTSPTLNRRADPVATSTTRGAATATPQLRSSSNTAEVNVSAASMCAADFTCPRSSVAWASGSFTGAGLLTPHSLALPVGLQLRLSLCCKYKFDGTILRSQGLYDTFLQELLQASPFQVLSSVERRQLFPHHLLYIVDTWERKRVYNASYRLTPKDVATHNDGDGDVLVLTTGFLAPASLHTLLSSSPALAFGGSSSNNNDSSAQGSSEDGRRRDSLGEGEGPFSEAVDAFPAVDMQLRITNRVLKCKCPHILTVMPLLHVRRDALPPIEITGLGAHCGMRPTQNVSSRKGTATATSSSVSRPHIHQVHRTDGTTAFAASFDLVQPLPPTTLVSWTVRQVEKANDSLSGTTAAATTVLRHTRVLPVVMDAAGRVEYSSAASPFFLVEANVRYEVSVTVSRGPLSSYAGSLTAAKSSERDRRIDHAEERLTSTAAFPKTSSPTAVPLRDWERLRISRSTRGRFVLRLPFNRSWALPPVHPAPHFGFRRSIKLTNATLSHIEVAAALDPEHYPLSPSFSSSSIATGPDGPSHSGGAGWLGLRRWTGIGGTPTPTRKRALSYYGYWENAPLEDQLLPQRAVQVPSNPFTDPSPNGVSMPLFIGCNLLAYVVRDVDDVCDPVVLEGREIWAVQSVVQTPGPITACAEKTDVSALVLRELYLRMRREPKIDVKVPNTSWSMERARPVEVGPEGFYRCQSRDKDSAGGAGAGPLASLCVVTPDRERDGSECFASLQMHQRGVHEVVWVARVEVRDARLAVPDNLDPLYARVVETAHSTNASLTSATRIIVEVWSHPLLVVRRQASYPAVVKVELPMYARRWRVSAPRALTSATLSYSSPSARASSDGSRSGSRGHDVLLDNAPTGYWRSRPPIDVLSVDERLMAELNTNEVPNVQRVLPNGTLEFVAQDNGEVMSLTTTINGVRRIFAYTSKCPDTFVEYQLHVVAFPPPPVTPAYAPVYTEEGCVVLVPPRAVRKDEVAEWRVPPCAAGRTPYLMERTLSVEEQEEYAYVTTSRDGGEPLLSYTQTLEGSAQNRTIQTTATVPARATVTHRPITVLMACGVEVYHRCDVVWSLRNLVAEVQKTYSLRRCQRPPAVLFHENHRQLRVSYPQSGIFQLPTTLETIYVPGNATPGGVGAEGPTVNTLALRSRQRRQRQIIPIAGYHSTLGYSFNYTGLQEHFELHLRPLPDAVAHQLVNTQHDYVETEDGAMVLRRRTAMDTQHAATWKVEIVDDSNADSSSSEYEAARAGASSLIDPTKDESYRTPTPTTSIEAKVQEQKARLKAQQRSRHVDQTLEETYIVVHESHPRRLRVAEVGNSSLFPMDYVVRGSPAAIRNAAAEEDYREFARRGMCVERPGYVAVLAVNPRGSVREGENYGKVLPAPAVAVLPFCAPRYTFARYPELSSVYGYEFTWVCPEETVMTVTKYHPTYSVISHTPEMSGGTVTSATRARVKNETLCELAVVNHITHTEQRDWFLVRRVYPTPLSATALVVLSNNAADSLQMGTMASSSSSSRRGPKGRNGATPSASATRGDRSGAATTVITMEELYRAPANMYPFTKARRVVGKSVVLHVDSPSSTGKAQWAVESVVPASTTTVGTQVLMSEVEFQTLYRHPVAVARGRGGSTVLVKGLRTPGLYTLSHTIPDPENPSVCPPVTLADMLDVFHARVLEKELVICGDTAALQAVPIPHAIAHEFVGQWEVVSLATDEATVWTAGVNFTGIRFERGTRAETLVHGLPFGIVTIRWAIYRILSTSRDDNTDALGDYTAIGGNRQTYPTGKTTSSTATMKQRVLVDFDTVEVFVLTENLPSHRLVTLADQATILTTSSTHNWHIDSVASGWGDDVKADRSAALTKVRMSLSTVTNYSDNIIHPFADTVGYDEAQRAMFHTYYGLRPRPGSGALTLQRLPVGTVHLRYDVEPSQSVFGKMIGHTCALQGHYDVERVSAYLTATTTLDHECDGYTGDGRITLCLHTEGADMRRDDTPTTGAAASSKKGQRRGTRTQSDAQFWQSQVRLADPERLEDIIKRGAREVEQVSRGRCATPWWVAPSTQWFNPSYTSSPMGLKTTGSVALPGRCVSFTVRAGRHLSAREVAQPLFVSIPRVVASAGGAVVSGGMELEGRRRSSGSNPSGACPFYGDFISTRVIDGVPLVEDRTASKPSAATGASTTGSFFGFSQLFQVGLPHTTRHGEGKNNNDDGGWGIRFLPVLQPSSLRRANATMRPMIGLRGVVDDVTTELNISGLGSGSSDGNGAPDVAATVLLRLDLTNSKRLGGYTLFTSTQAGTEQNVTSSSSTSVPQASPPLSVPHHSLLYKCVAGTVRGSDVLQYWTETNRPDGRVDLTAWEWRRYAYAVRDAPVPCDALFASLDHLMSYTYDPSYSPPQYEQTNAGGGRRAQSSPPSSTTHKQKQQRQQYVSLTEMEQQVERLRKQYRWTSDGIDVTGLPADLQSALSHRRVTTTQLRAIEAARRARQAAEEADASQHRLTHRELQKGPSHMSPMERLAAALRAYKGVAQGGEVAVLRIQLPLCHAFTVPYDIFLRTALHKDVVCGTSVDPPHSMENPTHFSADMNPYSVVPLGRVEIRDTPPVLRLYPPVVKQCEVEGGPPVLTFELTGANFAQDSFSAEDVLLEEIPNPALIGTSRHVQSHPDVGLKACVTEMRRGLHAVVEDSHKFLYLQLSACPFFKMLTPEEYNEHQDSEDLLRRLQFSRYLRVTVRRAIRSDSFLSGSTAAATAERRRDGIPFNTHKDTDGVWTVSQNRSLTSVTPTSTDASFIVEVRPTLARLHLHSSANMETPPDVRTTVGSVGGRHDSVKRIDGGSSWWRRTVESSREDPQDTPSSGTRSITTTHAEAAAEDASPEFTFVPTPARPLVLCEADLHRYGFQLGVELIGDTWTSPVGEEGILATTPLAMSSRSGSHNSALPRQRSPPNVALINSFSVVEHHSLDSSHHLYMKGGGVYRSHFINYLFSSLLSDPTVLRDHIFVHRYNSTFSSIVIPPLSAVLTRRDGAVRSDFAGAVVEEDTDFYAAQQQRQRRYPTRLADSHIPSSTPVGAVLPAVRQFCKVEEILFAVPGIATECRGCLLADTTFFVAGDLTGVWSPSIPSASPSSDTPKWSSETFTRPLVVPWDSVASIPREWKLDWICPAAAHRALERWPSQFGGSNDDAAAFSIVMDIVVYRVRGLHGEELPAHQRPTVLLSSQPILLADVLEQNRIYTRQTSSSGAVFFGQSVVAAPLRLQMNEGAVGAAYTQLTDDVLRHRRHAWTTMEYHHNARYADGLLVVNASVFLKLCAGRAACTVVSITDSLLTVETPRTAVQWTSWLHHLFGIGRKTTIAADGGLRDVERGASSISLFVVLHHVFMSYLCYVILPLLGIVVADNDTQGSRGRRSMSDSSMAEEQRAHVAYTAMVFVFLFFSYAYVPVIWMLLCFLIWTLSLYFTRRSEQIFLFVASVLYSHYLM